MASSNELSQNKELETNKIYSETSEKNGELSFEDSHLSFGSFNYKYESTTTQAENKRSTGNFFNSYIFFKLYISKIEC